MKTFNYSNLEITIKDFRSNIEVFASNEENNGRIASITCTGDEPYYDDIDNWGDGDCKIADNGYELSSCVEDNFEKFLRFENINLNEIF